MSFALQGVDEEDAANKSVRYILRNEEGAYFNNQGEWVDAADALVETEDGEWVLRDDLKLWIKAGQTVQVTDVPVGRYTVEELADDLAIEGYDLDGEASTLSLEVQVGTDVPAEAGLINAYQKVSEPEDVDATEEPAVPVARRGAKAPALRAGDGDDEEQEATLTDNLNLLFDASRSKLNGSPLVEGQEYEVWEGRPIALSLHFAQTETSQYGPYRDDRPLYYNLPTGVSMPPEYTGQTFKIDVGYDEDAGEPVAAAPCPRRVSGEWRVTWCPTPHWGKVLSPLRQGR
ncbi:MAG: hypothetical protein IKG11_03520 [Atopobiaceae bacterium]|nr:hypothetical protein [Atopobiaceae bacterium]